MHRGYVKLWRRALESSAWLDEGLWKVWCWCLMKASWEAKSMPFKAGRSVISVEIQPGQFVFGRKAASDELQMPPSTVRNRLEHLKKLGNVDIKADSNYSVVSVCNWERYAVSECDAGQRLGQGEDKERTRRGQGEDTKKKDNNSNKQNSAPENGQKPTLMEVAAYCSERQNNINPQAFLDHYDACGWRYGSGAGKPLKDWKAAVRTWENRRKQEGSHDEQPYA